MLRFEEFKGSEDWEEKALDKLGRLINGLTYTPDDVRESGLLVLRSSNVNNGQIVLDNNVYVRSDIKGVNLSEVNDILICIRNGSKALIGKNALIPEGLPRCTHGAFMTVFRSPTARFVFQLFQTRSYEKQVSGDLGATINSINGSNFLKYKFFVPPTSKEQQKIAACLSSLDELITAHTQKLEALKAHKKGLMQQLFPAEGEKLPKLRFAEFKDSGEWEVRILGEILLEGRLGGNYENSEVNDGIPVIKMGNLERGSINVDRVQYLPKETEYADGDILKEGDLLLNTRNTLELVGKVAIWKCELPKALYNSNLLRLTFREELIDSNRFMNYSFNTQKTLAAIRSIATGTTSVAAIYTKDLLSLDFCFPSPKEQQKIASCLSSLDALITAEGEKIAQLKLHKKGLMQGLFPRMEA